MYPLGLLILWLQIHLTYGEDLVVSWYAANLVPSPVVLGLGASAVWDLLTQGRYLFYLAVLFLSVAEYPNRDSCTWDTLAALCPSLGAVTRARSACTCILRQAFRRKGAGSSCQRVSMKILGVH